MSNTRAHGEISSKMLTSSFGTRDKKAFLKYPRTIDICTQCDNLDYVTQFTAILTKGYLILDSIGAQHERSPCAGLTIKLKIQLIPK